MSGKPVTMRPSIPIYRAPMRSRTRELPPGTGAEYGLGHGLVGIDPGLGDKAARSVHRFATLPDGVFVWTRDRAGHYHVGQLNGAMREVDTAAARQAGIRYVRPAQWGQRAYTESEVPPGVAATFARGGRNFQRTHGAEAEQRTAELWAAQLASQPATLTRPAQPRR